MMKINISKLGSRTFLTIGKKSLEVLNYEIKSSDKDRAETELDLKVILKADDKVIINELH